MLISYGFRSKGLRGRYYPNHHAFGPSKMMITNTYKRGVVQFFMLSRTKPEAIISPSSPLMILKYRNAVLLPSNVCWKLTGTHDTCESKEHTSSVSRNPTLEIFATHG